MMFSLAGRNPFIL